MKFFLDGVVGFEEIQTNLKHVEKIVRRVEGFRSK